MKLRFLIPILPVVVLSATAASIQTSATCQIGIGRTGMEIPSDCYQYFEPPWDAPPIFADSFALASASARATATSHGYGHRFSVRASAEAAANGYYPECCELEASSRSTSSVKQWFTTRGPVRDGLLYWVIDGDSYRWGTATSDAKARVGSHSRDLSEPPVGKLLAFRLGVPFLVELSADSFAYAQNSFANARSEMSFEFALYENDEFTSPVEVLSVPEPAGTAVIGILLMSLRLLRSKRRK